MQEFLPSRCQCPRISYPCLFRFSTRIRLSSIIIPNLWLDCTPLSMTWSSASTLGSLIWFSMCRLLSWSCCNHVLWPPSASTFVNGFMDMLKFNLTSPCGLQVSACICGFGAANKRELVISQINTKVISTIESLTGHCWAYFGKCTH